MDDGTLAPNSIQKLLDPKKGDKGLQAAIKKGMNQYLGVNDK
jgi:hypothetical protein